MNKFLNKKVLLSISIGIVIGASVVLGIRFAAYKAPYQVHYHANFAIYVNGVRQEFKGTQYYEETATEICTLHPVDSPKERAHMHDNVNSVVHVEDHLVTWGNFMQNLGWGMGDDYLKTTDATYTNGEQGKLSFILNGKPIESIAGQIIQDKDQLLISYGTDSSDQLQKEYKIVPATAVKYDTSKDPASCGASHSGVSTSERLHHLL